VAPPKQMNLASTSTNIRRARAVTNDAKKHRFHAITHGRKWVAGNAATIFGSVSLGPSIDHRWHQRCPLIEMISPGNTEFEDMTPLEAFLLIMPPDQLELILGAYERESKGE